MSYPIVQFGSSATADFEEKTWTFEMEGYYEVKAGDFAITEKSHYVAINHNLVIAREKLKAAEKALSEIVKWDDELEETWGDPGERASRCLEMLAKVEGF